MADSGTIDGVIGFLGAGRMAQALASGIVRAGLTDAPSVVAYDPSPAAGEAFVAAVGDGAEMVDSARAVAERSRIVLLAVKPVYAAEALGDAKPAWRAKEQLLVSVAAGVTTSTLESGLPRHARVIRVMPNTPCLIGQGASCYARGGAATDADAAEVGRLLGAVGFAAETPERLLDAVTGLSGSGPAFVYTMVEALADGGVRAGLPRELASQLAARTVAGAAEMVVRTGDHPAALRDAVASPGGTTIAGLAELEKNGVRAALIEAVTAAARRSVELGQSK